MIRYLVLPKIGLNMTEATIGEWLVQPGDVVEKEQVILRAETDKSVQDIFATDSGVLLKILAGEGTNVNCQGRIAVVGDEGDVYSEEENEDASVMDFKETQAEKFPTANRTEKAAVTDFNSSTGLRFSPRAKKYALGNNIDISGMPAKSGGRRIVEKDVEEYTQMLKSGLITRDVFEPYSRMRSVIGKHMTDCILSKPKVTLNTVVNCQKLISYREKLCRSKKVSYNEIIAKACAMTLKDNPSFNSVTADGGLIRKKDINIGVAVDTDQGLVVPVLKCVDKKDIYTLSDELKVLINKVKAGKQQLDDIQGGSMTITNLGSFGVESFDPIMNAPECFILGIGAMRKVPGVINGNLGVVTEMKLCLSFDHAAFDGAKAAGLLKGIKDCLETPDIMDEKPQATEITENAKTKSVIVIGGGPGGYVAAIKASQLGATVTLIEKEAVGGTCLNRGCMPTKALLHSADAYSSAKNSFNIGVEGEIRLNWQKVQENRKNVVGKLTGGVRALIKANGINHVSGIAKIEDKNHVRVGNEVFYADNIIVASGSKCGIPPIDGADSKACIDSTTCLELHDIPASMVIIGGGVVGVELAKAYSDFGCKITLVEKERSILPTMDRDIVAVAVKQLEAQGIAVLTDAYVMSIKDTSAGADVCISIDGKIKIVNAEKVLLSTGRVPDTADLGLEKAGIATENGYIKVNEFLETSCKDVYAIGDCTGLCMYAHAAIAMGEITAGNIFGQKRKFDIYTCPMCAFIGPEIAGVGYTEGAAKKLGIQYKVGRFIMAANGRSLTYGYTDGLVKMLADETTDRIIGVHIIGCNAAELIQQATIAMDKNMTLKEFTETIVCHPTVSEALREAALACDGRAVHIPNRKA